MKLYNTLTRKKETFEPQDGKTVRMYVCGPTVYDQLHIGNVRPVIVFDTLRKYFEHFKGWDVNYVQNVTDVDDKLIDRSLKTGDPVETIAARYTEAYFRLLDALGAEPPTHSPRATEHIAEMIELIKALIDKGLAYEVDGDVYYRVSAFDGYGKLSGRKINDLKVGARVAASEKKENPLDFTLWKAAKPGEPKWDSPWGEGRPGWHTECVVLSRRFLGETLDIHAGGNDLIFPHHENEIAQAEGLTEKPFARFWLHSGMLMFHGEKMSKSLGNFAYAHEVLEEFGAETVRYFYLSRHYRKPLDYSKEGLEEARKAISRVQTLIDEVSSELATSSPGEIGAAGRSFLASLPRFRECYITEMDDDLNTVGAIAAIQDIVSETNRFRATAATEDRPVLQEAIALIRELGYPLCLFQEKSRAMKGIEEELIRLLIDLRSELRTKKEFALSDRIRDRLAELGITLKDTAQGTIWT
jgi:cysteinyl-tRNA synthetase